MKPRPSIGILSGNPLCRNPRVLKEASTLARAGYTVTVLGAWWDDDTKGEDLELLADAPFRFVAVLDATGHSPIRIAMRWFTRLVARAARQSHRIAGVESRWLLGATVGPLLRAATARPFDLVIAHSEPALWVADRLSRRGLRVGIDFEDWYSEDLPPEARRGRPLRLLRRLEGRLLQVGAHATCPSQAMSQALAETYRCRPPVVIYNAFPWADRAGIDGLLKDRKDRARPSIHWYSQTLGPGRGLEELFASLALVDADAEVHLRGRPAVGFETSLRARIPEGWRDRVFFHDLVPNRELLSRIAEHDIGFAGESSACRSRDLTVTNKILHYQLAGLAVVAGTTTGQQEVAAFAGVGVTLVTPGEIPALASELRRLLLFPAEIRAGAAFSLRAAQERFCWERQEPVLLRSAAELLGEPPPPARTSALRLGGVILA